MKIKIIKNDVPIRVHHHPEEVIYDSKNNVVKVGNETFPIQCVKVGLESCSANPDLKEIHAIFTVKSDFQYNQPEEELQD